MNQERVQELMQQDLPDLVKVGFAETFANHVRVRRMGANSNVPEWVCVTGDEASEPMPMEKLPKVAGTNFALLEYLDAFVTLVAPKAPEGQKLSWGFSRTVRPHPQGLPIYCCRIVLIKEPDLQADVGVAYHTDPGVAIASAMLIAKPIDLPALHRSLFPHRYLLI